MLKRGEPRKKATKKFIKGVHKLSGGVPYNVQQICKIAFAGDQDNKLDTLDFWSIVQDVINSRDNRLSATIQDIRNAKHAVRVLRRIAEFDEAGVSRGDLIESVERSFVDREL